MKAEKRELWHHGRGPRDDREYDFRYDFSPSATRLVEIEYDLALKMVRQILAEVGRATVRQIYYVGSRRSWWEKDKSEKRNSYKRVSRWLTKMRADGYIDYDQVLEYGRQLSKVRSWTSPHDYATTCRDGFWLDRWAYQPNYVEVWVEGEAIAPIIEDALKGLDVPIMMNRGNTSTTAIRNACKRLHNRTAEWMRLHRPGLKDENDGFYFHDIPSGLVHILYVGDHDAAGWFMDQDLRNRLHGHARGLVTGSLLSDGHIQFKRVALTLDQVVEYDLDPDVKRASKVSQGKLYREHFKGHELVGKDGDLQWSFEALPPQDAKKIVRGEVAKLIDWDTWNHANRLQKAIDRRLRRKDGMSWLASLQK
jgi:hypothetical protein